MTYEVNNVVQEAVDNTDGLGEGLKFVVDRVILVNVANMDTDNEVTVTPDETGVYVTFDVVNDSNDTLAMVLLADVDTTAFTPTNLRYYREVANTTNTGFHPDDDELLAVTGDGILLANMDEEDVERIYVVYDMPSSATAADEEEAAVTLVAIAYENNGAGDTRVTEATNGITNEDALGGGQMRVDTVFGDLDGPYDDGTIIDGDEDGMHSATGTFVVATAEITVTKSSRVISDPFNGTADGPVGQTIFPKAIPGAVVEYCILVVNNGNSTASNVSIVDPIPDNTTYEDESIRIADDCDGLNAVAVDDNDTDADDTPPGNRGHFDATHDAGYGGAARGEVNTFVQTLADGDPTATQTATLFRVTID